ncbi:HMG-box, partial [Peniophora sp. CONT]
DKPPRPRNAWMLFLCAYHDERKAMREPPLIDPETAKHTKIVSERWKNLPMSEKEKWHAKAEQEKEDHAARYPGYKYQPSKHK